MIKLNPLYFLWFLLDGTLRTYHLELTATFSANIREGHWWPLLCKHVPSHQVVWQELFGCIILKTLLLPSALNIKLQLSVDGLYYKRLGSNSSGDKLLQNIVSGNPASFVSVLFGRKQNFFPTNKKILEMKIFSRKYLLVQDRRQQTRRWYCSDLTINRLWLHQKIMQNWGKKSGYFFFLLRPEQLRNLCSDVLILHLTPL